MLGGFLLEELAGRRNAGVQACLDRLLLGEVRMVGTLSLREVEADVREDLDRRVEQRDACEPIRIEHGELEDQPTAERMPDERRSADAGGVERLEDVVGMCRDRPRRLPAGEAVAAEVRREHPEAFRQPILRETPEAAPVGVDAVDADDRLRAGIAPLVEVQLHHAGYCMRCSRCCTTSTGASPHSTRCSRTRALLGPTRTSWAATTAPGAPARSAASNGCARCRARHGFEGTASGGRGIRRSTARRSLRRYASGSRAT